MKIIDHSGYRLMQREGSLVTRVSHPERKTVSVLGIKLTEETRDRIIRESGRMD